MHLIPQTILDAQVVSHSIVSRKRPSQSSSILIRIRQTPFILVLSNRRLRRRRDQSRIIVSAGSIVVNAHVAVAAANFHHARVHGAAAIPAARLRVLDGGRVDGIVAVAFLRVLDAAQTVAHAVADILAESDAHESVVRDKVRGEWAIVACTVIKAAEILLIGRRVALSYRWSDGRYRYRVDSLSDGRLHDVGRAVHRSSRCSFWAVCNLNTTWKFGNEASHRLIDLRLLLWTVVIQCKRLILPQNRAIGNQTKVIRGETIHCCVRKDLLIPAILEIGVEAVSSRIALREDEQAIRSFIRHIIDVIEDFQEDVWYLYGMGRRADTVVDRTLVSDV